MSPVTGLRAGTPYSSRTTDPAPRARGPRGRSGAWQGDRHVRDDDRHHDAEDREAGRRIELPLLLLTGREETQLADAPEIWRRWASDVTALELPGGHFLPEEAPSELVSALQGFLG